MKRLTCEMCGSTDLIKQEGVFVCQSCGCKYSVEEAKKMMVEVEGKVDVSGSMIKVDSSEKLANLYTLARRARNENNAEDASKYYAEIRLEDPNSWEAAFYGAYYTAMSCKIGQIASAASTITSSLNSVCDLIKSYVPAEEQKAAYTEVALRVEMIGTMLFNATKATYLDSSYSGKETDLHNRMVSILTLFAGVGIYVDEKFGDIILAEKVYKDCVDLCNSWYNTKRYVSAAEAKIKELEPRLRAAYWENRQDEKNRLESERNELDVEKKRLEAEISALQAQKESLPEAAVLAEINKKIAFLNQRKKSMGLFQKKEKAELQTQIDAAEKEAGDMSEVLEKKKGTVNESISPLRYRIMEIDRRRAQIDSELLRTH